MHGVGTDWRPAHPASMAVPRRSEEPAPAGVGRACHSRAATRRLPQEALIGQLRVDRVDRSPGNTGRIGEIAGTGQRCPRPKHTGVDGLDKVRAQPGSLAHRRSGFPQLDQAHRSFGRHWPSQAPLIWLCL